MSNCDLKRILAGYSPEEKERLKSNPEFIMICREGTKDQIEQKAAEILYDGEARTPKEGREMRFNYRMSQLYQ